MKNTMNDIDGEISVKKEGGSTVSWRPSEQKFMNWRAFL